MQQITELSEWLNQIKLEKKNRRTSSKRMGGKKDIFHKMPVS